MPETKGSTVLSPEALICGGILTVAIILAAVLYPGLGSLSIWSCAIALGVGGIAWVVLHFVKSDYRITMTEATLASVFLMVVIVPLVDHFGTKMAFDNKVSYQEFWGGYEASVSKQIYNCHESDVQGGSTGGCVHTFDADSYVVQVPYTVEVTDRAAYTDSKGNYHPAVTHTETRYRPETRWRQVPFTTTETSWFVNTTLGTYTVGYHWFPDNPSAHRIRAEDGSMDRLPSDVATGTPQQWTAAQRRIAAGDPGPVTQEHSYENYILASQDAALKRYSPYIDEYEKLKILPNLSSSVTNFYYLNRSYQVGNTGQDPAAWTAAVERFNAALGSTLQGNLYLVVADASKISDPERYISTLTAYWQSEKFAKYAISKNAIIVVLGTEDGKTVKWARASTGMPTGNSTMIYTIQNNLVGANLTPDAILGKPKASITQVGDKYKVQVLHTQPPGALEDIMWSTSGFERVCMTCKTEGDKGVGFEYLKTQIKPTGGQLFGIYAVVFFFALLVWGGMVFGAVPTIRQMLGKEPYGSNPQNFVTRKFPTVSEMRRRGLIK